jgi:hypothetical protein
MSTARNTFAIALIYALPTLALCAWAQSAGPTPTVASSASRASLAELLAAVVQRFEKPLKFKFDAPDNLPAAQRMPVVILTGKAAELYDPSIKSKLFQLMTEPAVVALQLASFVLVTQVGAVGDDILLDYEIPSNASYGVMRIAASAGFLSVDITDSYRSSSGARATYGKMYEKTVCQNGTEMAYRWNYYRNDKGNGTCPGSTFADVLAYQRSQSRNAPGAKE